jgi:hypothetical protein
MMHAMETSESTEDDSVSDGGPWFGRLSGQERTAFVATFAGWMLDGLEGIVFSVACSRLTCRVGRRCVLSSSRYPGCEFSCGKQ